MMVEIKSIPPLGSLYTKGNRQNENRSSARINHGRATSVWSLVYRIHKRNIKIVQRYREHPIQGGTNFVLNYVYQSRLDGKKI